MAALIVRCHSNTCIPKSRYFPRRCFSGYNFTVSVSLPPSLSLFPSFSILSFPPSLSSSLSHCLSFFMPSVPLPPFLTDSLYFLSLSPPFFSLSHCVSFFLYPLHSSPCLPLTVSLSFSILSIPLPPSSLTGSLSFSILSIPLPPSLAHWLSFFLSLSPPFLSLLNSV